MPFTMVVDQPALGNQELYIHGLGSFANGTYEISDEQDMNFRLANMREVGGFITDEDSPAYGAYQPEQELGPSLVDAAESMHGITVTEKNQGQTQTSQPQNSRGPVVASTNEGPEVNK